MFALYLDPARKTSDQLPPHVDIIFLRWLDADDAQIKNSLQVLRNYPAAHVTAELHPSQLAHVNEQIWRISLHIPKSQPQMSCDVPQKELDITFHWDARRKPQIYFDTIKKWHDIGAKHFSLYHLTDEKIRTMLRTHLQTLGLTFYDRFHVAIPGHESRFVQHSASYGDTIALGGWSRLTENGITRIKGPRGLRWKTLTAADVALEKQLLSHKSD